MVLHTRLEGNNSTLAEVRQKPDEGGRRRRRTIFLHRPRLLHPWITRPALLLDELAADKETSRLTFVLIPVEYLSCYLVKY